MKKKIMKFISRIPLLRYIYNVIVDARMEREMRRTSPIFAETMRRGRKGICPHGVLLTPDYHK